MPYGALRRGSKRNFDTAGILGGAKWKFWLKGASRKKHPLSVAPCASGLVACLSLVALCPQKAAADPQISGIGETYIITNTVSTTGAFSSRGVITFNADHTLFVVDSAQGGPQFFFGSQQGTWGTSVTGTLAGRTIDFDFSPTNDVARLDYTFKFDPHESLSGTSVLRTFPLKANPLDGGGTLVGTFNFTGHKVTLP